MECRDIQAIVVCPTRELCVQITQELRDLAQFMPSVRIVSLYGGQSIGKQLDALKKKLIKEYSRYYRQPQVSVTFAPYDGRGVSPWGTVTVLGEVVSPGHVNIPSTMDLPVTKVLQMAGGLKPYADRSRICVTRCDRDGKQHKTYVDLKEIGKDGRPDKDMLLRAGDVVWVPETWY
jgi:protein involved in polysaccharide export with SLBB domain